MRHNAIETDDIKMRAALTLLGEDKHSVAITVSAIYEGEEIGKLKATVLNGVDTMEMTVPNLHFLADDLDGDFHPLIASLSDGTERHLNSRFNEEIAFQQETSHLEEETRIRGLSIIESLFIDKDHRRQGVGEALIMEFKQLTQTMADAIVLSAYPLSKREEGVTIVNYNVDEVMAVRQFYRELGFASMNEEGEADPYMAVVYSLLGKDSEIRLTQRDELEDEAIVMNLAKKHMEMDFIGDLSDYPHLNPIDHNVDEPPTRVMVTQRMNLVARKANPACHAALSGQHGYATIEALRQHAADFTDSKVQKIKM